MRKRVLGILMIILGAAFLAGALLLHMHNREESGDAGTKASAYLSAVRARIPVTTVSPTKAPELTTPDLTKPRPEDTNMKVVDIDGYGYIGYLKIPSQKIELPVMADWDYTRLKIAPCRQFGSSKAGNLVIAAHNYETHFGKMKDWPLGTEIIFTDMEGHVTYYRLARRELVDPYNVKAVKDSGYPLVLYTCETYWGGERLVGFCEAIAGPGEGTVTPGASAGITTGPGEAAGATTSATAGANP